jgi:DNA-binding transcriptional LysR family regulator
MLAWDDVRYFVALARHGTLAATARALQVDHATVSRRLGSLEATLGRPLFDRRTDGYVLTAAGKSVLDEAAAMEEAAAAVSRRLDSGTAIAGLVRVTVARVLADGFVVERLGGLVAKYPELDLEIVAGSRNLSLARREADLALRLGRPAEGALIARRIATLDYEFYASPAYWARVGAGEPAVFVGFDDDSEFVPEAAWAKRALTGKRSILRSNSQTSQAAAARGGLGIALLPRLLAHGTEGLVPVELATEPPPRRELWLLMRRDVARVPRVRVVADYLVEMFRTTV